MKLKSVSLKRRSESVETKRFNFKRCMEENVYVKETWWTNSELDGDEGLSNRESLPVVQRIQEIQLKSLLSISVKKIQLTNRK